MKLYKTFALLAVTSLLSGIAHAGSSLPNILITIDESDPSNVIFTATSNAPTTADSTHFFGDGIDLVRFLTTSLGGSGIPVNSSSLLAVAPGAGTLFYDRAGIDHLSGTYTDFNPYNFADYNAGQMLAPATNGVTAETFALGTSAFSGTLTANFGALASLLPGLGTTDDIYAGYSGDINGPTYGATPVVIGQWEVIAAPVPEPSQWGCLVFLGAALLVGSRRLTSTVVNA